MKVDKEIKTADDFQRIVENAAFELWQNTKITVTKINVTTGFSVPKELQFVHTEVDYKS